MTDPRATKYSPPSPAPRLVQHLALWLLASLTLCMGWTGFIASDDAYYVRCGLGWLHDFPFVARSFGEIRAAVCIPMAASFGLLGESEFTATLSTTAFLLGTASVTLTMLARVIAPGAAFIASAALLSLPLLATTATIPNADVPELFFVTCSFWLFWEACRRERRFVQLILAGVAAALAFSAHEVSLALLAFYGLLFLGGYAIPRRQYWIMAIGFFGVLVAEMSYYWMLTGNPAHRLALFVHGAGLRDRTDVGFFEFTPGGTLHIWDPIDPLLMLFTHVHQFGVVAYASIPGLWWALRPQGEIPTLARGTARLLVGLGVVWLAFATATLTNQQVLPRYYSVTIYCLYVVAAIWTAEVLWPKWRKAAVSGVIAVVLAGIVGILVANTNPRFGERVLVDYLARSTEPVYTDPLTADRAQWYCRWKVLECARIATGAPPPGTVYFYNPQNADQPNRFVKTDEVAQFRPKVGWEQVDRLPQPPRWIASVLERTGVTNVLPHRVYQKLMQRSAAVAFYRVPK